MTSMDDPGNKIRDGLYIDDDRESVIEHNDDGSTTFHRYYGDEWHEHRASPSEIVPVCEE